jgi:molybdenum-dependent DNA-binding transcriptional regulator ModE
MKQKLLRKLTADLEKEGSVLALSKKTGMPYATLWRMLKGGGGLRNWEKIEDYYHSKIA